MVSKTGVSVTVETITPEMASRYLASQSNIRPIQRTSVDRLVQMMRSGQFALNGESVKFNREGRLFDGQHRMTACVVSGMPFTTVVVRGAEEPGVDEGQARTLAQLIGGMGEKNWVLHGSLTRVLYFLERHEDPWMSNDKVPNATLLDFRRSMDMPAANRGVAIGAKCKLLPPVVAAAFFYMAQKKHEADAVESFVATVESGENLAAGSPRMELRRWMEGRRREKLVQRLMYRNAYIAIVRAWTLNGSGEKFHKTAIWSRINDSALPALA